MTSGIDHCIGAVQAAVPSLGAAETDDSFEDAFDQNRLPSQWAWEHLDDTDRDAFFQALQQKRYVEAHAILVAAEPWPWRHRQWDAWLAARTS